MCEIIEEIGHGSFGIVYKVKRDDEYFAKKIFQPNRQDLTDIKMGILKQRFIREVRKQSTFNHENVMPVLDADLENVTPWFIMPLGSHNYRKQIAYDKKNEISKEPLFEILDGLNYIHEKGFVHRDLRPDNIIYLDNRYVIADFGLILEPDSTSDQLTSSGDLYGNPSYSAPEIFSDYSNVTRHADIYSFGCILCDLLDVLHFGPIRPSTAPSVLGSIIEICTAIAPEDRYNSVNDLKNALSFAFSTDTDSSSQYEDRITSWKNSIQNDPQSIDAETWLMIIDFAQNASTDEAENIFELFDTVQFEIIKAQNNSLFDKFVNLYCEWIGASSFLFSYCDILTLRLNKLYSMSNDKQKATIAIATLKLGYNHNRFSAMRAFIFMANKSISIELGNLIASKLIVMGEEGVLKVMTSLEIISTPLEDLSPQIVNAIKIMRSNVGK